MTARNAPLYYSYGITGLAYNPLYWSIPNQPISSSQASGLYLSTSGGTISGSLTVQDDVIIDGSLVNPQSILTLPVSSHTATTAFTGTLAIGSSVKNLAGYDILANISTNVLSSVGGYIVAGVSSATGMTLNAVCPPVTGTIQNISFSQYVPANYYLEVSTSGTISIADITVQSCSI